MNYLSLDDGLVSSSTLSSTTSYASLDFVEDSINQNYKRFIISGAVMASLAKFYYNDSNDISMKKGLYLAGATLVSDLLLGVAIKMGYLDNQVSGNYQSMAAQVLLESCLYFPLASGFQVIVPNFGSNAFKGALTASGASQIAQVFLLNPKSASN